ncbi:MAG TPA: hypothetical protein VGH27_11325 [Streptosporangiaceae bacterium]|jgi:hypothetical protein
MTADPVAPGADPATAAPTRPETMSQVVLVLGDTSIDVFMSAAILETNDNVCAVLASTERETIVRLDQPGGFRSRFPQRVFTVDLKPAPAEPAVARPELEPWLTARPNHQRQRGGPDGALDRADATTRLWLSEEFRAALTAALIWAHARPASGNHLAVGVTCFAVAGRMTGSGTVVAALDLLEQTLVDFQGQADECWIDLLIGTASIHQHATREFDDARRGSAALVAELGVALDDPATAGPSGRFGRHLGQILVLGPPQGGGSLRDVAEANASLALALSAIVSGDSQRQREALRPGVTRVVNDRGANAVFAGIGALEVTFDAALAAPWAAARLLADMPMPVKE